MGNDSLAGSGGVLAPSVLVRVEVPRASRVLSQQDAEIAIVVVTAFLAALITVTPPTPEAESLLSAT